MEENELIRLSASIDGRVQGVGFRFFVLEKAQLLNLTGWVRNTYDGKVEVVAEGSRPQLDQLMMYLRQGPSSAFVSEIKVEWENATQEYGWFDIRPTT